MTDEILDQILKQALTPENTLDELKIKKRARIYYMNKLMISGIAVAACVAICLGGCYFMKYHMSQEQEKISDMAISDVVTKLSDSFTIKVHAAELTKDQPLPITMKNDFGANYVLGSSEGSEDTVYYCYNLPLSCEGENIKSITYSINKGCFQIVEPADEPYVTETVAHTGDDTNFGQCGGFIDEEKGSEPWRESQVMYCDSFSVDYGRQTGEDFWINVGNIVPDMKEAFDLIWNGDGSVENLVSANNMLLSGLEITVEATFEDGSRSTKVICLESKAVEEERDGGAYQSAVIFVKEK